MSCSNLWDIFKSSSYVTSLYIWHWKPYPLPEIFLKNFLLFYMRDREKETEGLGDKERAHPLVHSPPWLGHGWSWELGTQCGSRTWVAGTSYLIITRYPLRVPSRKLESRAAAGMRPRHSETGLGHPNGWAQLLTPSWLFIKPLLTALSQPSQSPMLLVGHILASCPCLWSCLSSMHWLVPNPAEYWSRSYPSPHPPTSPLQAPTLSYLDYCSNLWNDCPASSYFLVKAPPSVCGCLGDLSAMRALTRTHPLLTQYSL